MTPYILVILVLYEIVLFLKQQNFKFLLKIITVNKELTKIHFFIFSFLKKVISNKTRKLSLKSSKIGFPLNKLKYPENKSFHDKNWKTP